MIKLDNLWKSNFSVHKLYKIKAEKNVLIILDISTIDKSKLIVKDKDRIEKKRKNKYDLKEKNRNGNWKVYFTSNK